MLFFLLIANSQSSFAQTPPAGFNNSLAGGGYNQPVGMCFSTDGNRMWVWEKSGKVFVSNFVNGSFQKQASPVLDISEEVGDWLDHGMLGFAFDPNFDSNGYIYVSYVVDRHHLIYFGTGNYNRNTNDYKSATIGRITRYRLNNTNGTFAADYNSRKILLGESNSTGIPILFETHGVGSLVFGRDGTLLASCGDGGGAAIDKGSARETYYAQALADGIIRPEENVGNYRAQMLNCHSGKILRLDPETGDGVSSNPFYDGGNPRAVKSKVWTIGLRNPCRMTIKPNTGSYNRGDANPGEIMVGDVGQGLWEEFSNIREGGLNCGWPIYEGIEAANGGFLDASIVNRDEPNPLNNQNGCFKPYFSFYNELLKEDVPYTPGTPVINCGTGSYTMPGSWKRYYHHRPVVDWHHARQGDNRARVPVFNGNTATSATIGEGNSFVNGERFEGNAAVGCSFYTGYNFPAEYRGAYFQGDYDGKWIRCFKLDGNGKLTEVKRFIDNGANVVSITENFRDGCLYYIDIVSGQVRRISYGSGVNNPPVAIATSDKVSGNSPLAVQFTGSSSYDPDGGALSYEWDFGDGTGKDYTANPNHTFYGGGSVGFTVTLTVKDQQNASSSATIRVSLNNTTPTVRITNPLNNSLYQVGGQEVPYTLTANVSDAESANTQLAYAWTISLRHNEHQHFEPVNTATSPTVRLAALGCDGDPYHYYIKLEVTDLAGLIGIDSIKIYPDCETFLNAKNLASTRGNGFVNLTWDNTIGTYSEVMIVAKPTTAINGLPAGNGSNYNADANFQGLGSIYDGGKVVYKGRGTSANITGLANGTTYNFRIFTRMNIFWTAGIQTSNTPQSSGANSAIITLNSQPAGANFIVNGTARTAPFIYESTQGTAQNIQASPSFVLNNNTYNFVGWSNGTNTHAFAFTTPNNDVSYLANYNLVPNTNNGTGLTARYYNNANQGFDTPLILTRTDATVDFTWAGASPGTGVNADYFTTRWTGQVLPRFSEEYTFYTVSDDGIRLWVNNVLLINKWIDQGSVEWNGKITLNAGQRYDIKIEYYEKGGDATAKLLWSSASQTKQAIPVTQLFPENAPTSTAPFITTQPINLTVVEMGNALFSITATGTSPFTYQWQKNGINITNATAPTYAITGVSLVDNGAKFKCIVSNSAASVTSNEATLTVTIGTTLPVITTQPANQTITVGGNVTFTVAATGTAPLAYQWQKNNVNIAGATTATYTLTGATLADNGAKFKCLVTNSGGTATSNEGILTVNVAVGGTQNGLTARYYTNTSGFLASPVVTRVDANVYFNWALGSPDALVSTNNWTARWVGKVRPLNNEEYTFYTISDDGVRLWVNNVLLIDKWVYQGSVEWNGKITLTAGQLYDIKVEYFDGGGDAVCRLSWSSPNQAKQTIPTAQLFPEGYTDPEGIAPSIITQPANQTITVGGNVTFTVAATGTAPLAYQWQKNNVNIVGATTATYTLTGATLADNGAKLKCSVTNSVGTIVSNEATLTVNTAATAPLITTQPASQTITVGGNVTFTVVSTGTAPLSYQWQKNNVNIVGATTNTYTLNAVTLADNGAKFKCLVNNSVNVAISNEAVLTVNGGGNTSGNGSGLTGRYFANFNKDFIVPVTVTRTDATIDFGWGIAAPAASISADNFSVRWTGKVEAQYGEEYTFYITTDDGARVWVNNVKIIDKWWDQGTTEWNGKITLAANQKYDIKIEYFDNTGNATCKLSWSSATQAKQIVPVDKLYPEEGTSISAPLITTQPANQNITIGGAATFTIVATGTSPLTFQWQKNNTNIAGATFASFNITNVVLADNGAKFKCVVSNSVGSVTSNEAILYVVTGANTAPIATISQPIDGFNYKAGDVLSFMGTGMDAEDGILPASAFTWWIDVFHDTHTHAGMAATQGITSGTYTIPREHGEATTIFLRLYLKVTDSQGLSTTITKDIQPQWATLTFNSNPTAVPITMDNLNIITTPSTVQSVKGVTRTAEAPTTYTTGGNNYRFKNWSTGATTPLITFNTPEVNTTYTATYELVPVAAGTGLTGRYFANSNKTFTGTTALTRTDATVNFDWGQTAPDVSVGADNFTVRWTGKVQAQYSEEYTFYSNSDDGIRVWVNNVLLIDKWFDQGPNVEWNGKITLVANQQYDLKVEYYDNMGRALVRLAWSSASTPKQIVPTSQLFPEVTGGIRNATATKTEESFQTQTEKLFVYPIPTDGVLHIRIISESDQKGVLQVYDPMGRFMFQKEELLKSGRNDVLIDTENLTSGSYYLRVNLKEDKITKPFSRE